MLPREPQPKNLRGAVSAKMIRNDAVLVTCPFCVQFRSVMTFKKFREEHVRDVHQLDPKRECVFCCGAVRWDWGQKWSPNVGSHILQCLDAFLNECKSTMSGKRLLKQPKTVRVASEHNNESITTTGETVPNEDEEVLLLDMDPLPTCLTAAAAEPSHGMCECVDFPSPALAFDMSQRTRFTEFKEFYEPLVNEKPTSFWYKPTLGDVAFQLECGLGSEVAGMIRMQRVHRWTFYHVFLRPCAVRAFNEVMGDHLLNRVAVSPYGCLCDGMMAFDDGGRHHRHVIVATDANVAFSRACRRVRCKGGTQRNRGHECCMRKYKITSTPHLISAIRYVSNPESHCGRLGHLPQARDPCMKYSDVGARDHHYFISRPMHRHAILPMSVLYPGGLRWLATKHNSRKSIVGWNYREKRQPNGRWKYSVRLGETGIEMRDCVLRWAKDLELANDDEDIQGSGMEAAAEEEEEDQPVQPYIPDEGGIAAEEVDDVDDEMEGEEELSDEVLPPPPNEEKPFRIYLIGKSRRLRSNPAMSQWRDQDWIMHQAERGNRFLHCVEDVDWQFSKTQAHMANQIRKVKDKLTHDHERELLRVQEHFRNEIRMSEEMKAHLMDQLRTRDELMRTILELVSTRDDQLRAVFEQLSTSDDLNKTMSLYLLECARKR